MMAKSVAVKIMLLASVLWRSVDSTSIKIMERGDCAHFSLPQHNMRLVALESSPNGCLDFVCGSSLGNQESEEQVGEAGD